MDYRRRACTSDNLSLTYSVRASASENLAFSSTLPKNQSGTAHLASHLPCQKGRITKEKTPYIRTIHNYLLLMEDLIRRNIQVNLKSKSECVCKW